MNLFSLIHDAARSTPFAIAVKKDNNITFYGVHAVGQIWSDEMNSKKLSPCCWSVPSSMVRSEYKAFKDNEEKLLIESFNIANETIQTKSLSVENSNLAIKYAIPNSTVFLERHVLLSEGRMPKVKTTEKLNKYDRENKQICLEYKVKSFNLDRRMSSFAKKVKQEKLGFDRKTNLFKNRPSNELFNYPLQQTVESIGIGAVRRFGRKFLVDMDSGSVSRRVDRRAKILSKIELKNSSDMGLGYRMNNLMSMGKPFDFNKSKPRKKGKNRKNRTRYVMHSGVMNLDGVGLVSGTGVSTKSGLKTNPGPEYIRENDPDVFMDPESARFRSRQLGCIGISRRISKNGRAVWTPCTNMTDYARLSGSTPLGRRHQQTNAQSMTRTIVRQEIGKLKRKKSISDEISNK